MRQAASARTREYEDSLPFPAEPRRCTYRILTSGDGAVANITPLLSVASFDCTVGHTLPEGGIAFQVIDDFGEPVVGAPITWTVNQGGGSISADPNLTDSATEQPPA